MAVEHSNGNRACIERTDNCHQIDTKPSSRHERLGQSPLSFRKRHEDPFPFRQRRRRRRITNALVPSKIEGVAFGQDVTLDGASFHTLWVANDNDFSLATSGTNQFFVFAVTDADLGAIFEPQAIAAAVPEPQTYALFGAGIGLLAAIVRRRRRGERRSHLRGNAPAV